MQLTPARPPGAIRARLAAAACLLVASGAPMLARAQEPGALHLDAAALVYGEQSRTSIVEPMAKLTRLFADGQSLSAQFAVDVMTGASPSGEMPAGRVQTVTSASGRTTTTPADAIPTKPFSDFRGALDLEWVRPIGSLFTATTGGHYSRERDYQSAGANLKTSLDVMHRLTTLTLGGGYNRDSVFPVGGTRVPLSDGTEIATTAANAKRVTTGLAGVSRVLTRRWIVGLNASLTEERGYLTEPYKLVSLVGPDSGLTVGSITENRPATRERRSLLLNSTYHLPGEDVAYTSYRIYRDDWGIRSHTVDLRWRHEMPSHDWFEPHVRLYTQTAADLFRFGLVNGAPVPEFVTSDERLGPLHGVTLGGSYGFKLPGFPGDLSVRAEYLRQWGSGRPPDAVGIQRQFDLFPPVNTGSLVIGWSVDL